MRRDPLVRGNILEKLCIVVCYNFRLSLVVKNILSSLRKGLDYCQNIESVTEVSTLAFGKINGGTSPDEVNGSREHEKLQSLFLQHRQRLR